MDKNKVIKTLFIDGLVSVIIHKEEDEDDEVVYEAWYDSDDDAGSFSEESFSSRLSAIEWVKEHILFTTETEVYLYSPFDMYVGVLSRQHWDSFSIA